MKKILLSLVAMVTLFTGSVWASEVEVATCDFTKKTAKHSFYNDSWTYGDFTVYGGANNNGGWTYIKLGGKSTVISTANPCYVATTKDMSDDLSKITVNIPEGSLSREGMSVTSWGVKVYSDADMTTEYDYVEGKSITKTADTYDFTPSANKTWDKSYRYVVTFTLTNTTTYNGIILVDKITYYTHVETGKTSTTTSFPAKNYTTYLDETFTSPTATVSGGDGLVPTYSSDNTDVATVNASTGAVSVVAAGTANITASYAGDDNYEASSASYALTVGNVYASLADLVAGGEPTTPGVPVKVTLPNEKIQSIAVSSQNVRNGIYLLSGTQQVEIYCNNVPDAWKANGTVSGTITGTWKKYGTTWEICPADWSQLTYTDPTKPEPTLTLSTYSTKLETGASEEVSATYTGDGTLSVTSSDPEVASVELTDVDATITALKAGTTTITFKLSETDTYLPKEVSYKLTVTEKLVAAAIPFEFDGGYAEATPGNGMIVNGLTKDYASSPKLKFDTTGDYLIINTASEAKYLHYTIKGNGSDTAPGAKGQFDVLESADGTDYSTVKSYTEINTGDSKDAIVETNINLASTSRFVKFIYTTKTSGNVALGAIKINNEEATGIESVSAAQVMKSGKFIENGQIVIRKNNRTYNLAGQIVK